jgi:hypothetical protein
MCCGQNQFSLRHPIDTQAAPAEHPRESRSSLQTECRRDTHGLAGEVCHPWGEVMWTAAWVESDSTKHWEGCLEAHVNDGFAGRGPLAVRRQLGFCLGNCGPLLAFARFADKSGHRGSVTFDLAIRWAQASPCPTTLTSARRFEVLRPFSHVPFAVRCGDRDGASKLLRPR